MRKVITALAFITFSSQCMAERPPKTTVLRPYYDCMLTSISKYSKKTKSAEEAILASKSVCEKQRQDIVIKATSDFIAKGRSQYQAELTEKSGIRKVDELFHPDFVRAALDAK